MSEQDITQISLGGLRVGIAGLKAAIEEAKPHGGRPDEEIAQLLYEKLRLKNYIPATAADHYKRAFLREFKKALGAKVEEEKGSLHIKILGPGCPACESLGQLVMAVLAEMRLPAEVEHIRDLKKIRRLGVFGLPALLINDEVKAVGQLPSKETLKQMLAELDR